MIDKILDFDENFFGNLEEYKNLIISLLETLKHVTPPTLWSIAEESPSGLTTDVTLGIMNIIFDSFDKVSDNLYQNKLIRHEFPLFVETKEMIEYLITDQIYESDEYINLSITLFSEFFTLLEVKLLLFEGYQMEFQAPPEVIDEYDKELAKYMDKLDNYKTQFLELND